MKFSKLIGMREVLAGEMIPDWYGFGKYDMRKQSVICYPLGLNLIIGFINAIHVLLVAGVKSRTESYVFKAGFHTGYEQGSLNGQSVEHRRVYMEGFEDGLKVAEEKSLQGYAQQALPESASTEGTVVVPAGPQLVH